MTITPEEIAKIRWQHQPFDEVWCWQEEGVAWPCPTIRALDALEATREALEPVAEVVCSSMCESQWETAKGQSHCEACRVITNVLADEAAGTPASG